MRGEEGRIYYWDGGGDGENVEHLVIVGRHGESWIIVTDKSTPNGVVTAREVNHTYSQTKDRCLHRRKEDYMEVSQLDLMKALNKYFEEKNK